MKPRNLILLAAILLAVSAAGQVGYNPFLPICPDGMQHYLPYRCCQDQDGDGYWNPAVCMTLPCPCEYSPGWVVSDPRLHRIDCDDTDPELTADCDMPRLGCGA